MNYKPEESTLIAYLYGELDEKEMGQVSEYLENHPEERKRLEGLADTRSIIGVINDKEVIAPPVFVGDHETQSLWQSTPVRWTIGIAASFLFLLVAARLLGMEVIYTQGEMRISFGRKEVSTVPAALQASLTPQDVQSMINATVLKNNEAISSSWIETQKKMDQSIRQQFDRNSLRVQELMTNASVASQKQVSDFVNGLQNENLRSMKDYLQLSSNEQKKYVENLLVDFSKYLQEQRKQDLNAFQTRMSSMESNTNQFKQETEEILSSIISNSGGKRQNNY